jgi:hypothetical protein
MGHFVTFPSRKLLAQTEARMTHFVTLTVPSARTDHSLRHSTTRVGLRARRVRILFFRENVRFRRFSWAIPHGFRHPDQFFGNLRIVTKSFEMTFYEVSIDFLTIGSTFQVFYGSFRCLSEQKITCSNGSQNDTFRHSNGPSSMCWPQFKA